MTSKIDLTPLPSAARRSFMSRTGTLSAVAVAVLAGREALAQGMGGDTTGDLQILNVALGLEHEAINAYQLGATSGLLQKPVLDVAVQFQGHHMAHRDALIATILKLGGKPVMELKLDDYARALKAHTLKNQADVLGLARGWSWARSTPTWVSSPPSAARIWARWPRAWPPTRPCTTPC